MAVKLGDILYRAASAWLRLPGNITTTRKVLAQTGDGVDSAAPEWTDEYADKDYVAEQIAAANIGGAAQNSFLVSGGQIVWIDDYDFLVSAASYYIDGVLYSSPESSITLNASDPTYDRIDVIAVDNTGTVVKITGVASSTPSLPDIDPGTQLALGFVLVPAASTQPVVATEVIYFENAGSPGEWDWTETGTTFDVNSTNNPKSPATKCIEGTSAVATDYAQGQIGTGTYDPLDARLLVLYIRSKATWNNNRGLSITLRNAGVLVGQAVNINRTGSFGFDSSVTGVYQLVAIPVTLFAVPIGQVINQIRITAFGNNHGFYIGDITFQEEGAVQQPTGITREQADALYAQKDLTFLTKVTEADLPNSWKLVAGTNITFNDTTPGELTIISTASGSGITELTGEVTAGPGSGSQAATITLNAVTNAKLAQMVQATIKGRESGTGTGDPVDLTSTQATTILNTFLGDTGSGGTKGLVVAPAAGDAAAGKFLKADATWTVPGGGGDVTGPASSTDTAIAKFNGTTGKVIQNSGITIDGSNNLAGITSAAIGGTLVSNTKLTVEGQVNIKPSNHSAAGTTETIDFSVSNEHTVILDENVTLTLSNPVDGGRYVIIFIQDASGGNSVTWPSTVRWPAGTAPTITSGANKADLVTLYYISSLTIYLGSFNQDYTTT